MVCSALNTTETAELINELVVSEKYKTEVHNYNGELKYFINATPETITSLNNLDIDHY